MRQIDAFDRGTDVFMKLNFRFGRYELIGVVSLISIIYINLIRAVVFDSLILVPIFTAILFLMSVLAVSKRKAFQWPTIHVVVYSLLLLLMCAFVANYKSDRLFIDLFLYYVTPCLFFAFFAIFRYANVPAVVIRLCALIFAVDVAFVLLEVADGVFYYDVHSTSIITWYMESDTGRFEHVYAGRETSGASLLDLLPPVLGIRGWPNYTAPLYSAVFVIVLAYIYGVRDGLWAKWAARFAVLVCGLTVLYLLGVKTHFVTVLISIVIIALRLHRRLAFDVFLVLLGLILFTVGTEFGAVRFENYMEQLFVGGHRFEGNQAVAEAGRLDVIFNFREYLALLDLSGFDLLAGLSSFSQFFNSEFLFEQKILVYMIVLGVPYVLLICVLMLIGMRDAFSVKSCRSSMESESVLVGAGCAVLILFLELGHFGFTMNYPNYQFLFFLLASVAILKRHRSAESSLMKAGTRQFALRQGHPVRVKTESAYFAR